MIKVHCNFYRFIPLHTWTAGNNTWPHFYQTRSAWSVDQGSNKNNSPAHNFAPTVTKFCVMLEGLSLPHDTKLGNCRCKIVDSRAFPSWSLIHGLRWSRLIKAEPVWKLRLSTGWVKSFTHGDISTRQWNESFIFSVTALPFLGPGQLTNSLPEVFGRIRKIIRYHFHDYCDDYLNSD